MFGKHELICSYDLWIKIDYFGNKNLCVLVVFSVDYNDELDLLVSGSADFTVKVWALSAGACLNTLTGHTEWVTKVS